MHLRILLLAMLLTTVTACDFVDTMKEGLAHTQAISAQLEKSVGLKSFVESNWNNGSLDSVKVTFEGIPGDETLTDIAEDSLQTIESEFKQTPKQLVISFSIEP